MKDWNDLSLEEKYQAMCAVVKALSKDCATIEEAYKQHEAELAEANKLNEAYKIELQRINYVVQSFMQIHPWHGLDENDVYVKGTDADKLRAIHDILKNGRDIGITVW